MKRGIMLLGVAAMVSSANADGGYVDVTNLYMKEATYMPGWQGVAGATGEGVCEVWNGAFRLYQVLRNVPAGDYTLTVDAFYRCGNNDFAKANMPLDAKLYKAYIFAGDSKETVKGLFDGRDTAPNSMAEANAAFAAGEYVNTLSFTHAGGDLVVGIANTGCYHDEWCCFDNFKLVGADGEIAIENADFSTGIDSKRAWNNFNADGGEKTPDMQKDGSGGGDYRKCGGSPYKYGQQIELPAGKYRFGMQTFHRYGSEVDAAGNYYNHKWPCDINANGGYGRVNRTPKDWFEAGDYETEPTYDHAYIFMSKNEECPKDLNLSEDMGDLDETTDLRVRIKDCWEINNGDLDAMPHNNPVRVAGNEANADGVWNDVIPYETINKAVYRNDSGTEREAAAAFVNEAEKYYQYVEFELSEPAKVWVGIGKNSQTSDGYWHAWANQTLMMFDESAAVEGVEVDENAPEVYYNLQGVRVSEPANGIFIVKKGNKATKQIFK